MQPDRLPEEYLRINGFQRVRGNENYVEWRRVSGDSVERTWIEFGGRGPPVWDVLYIEESRRHNTVLDQETVGEFQAEQFDNALRAAAQFMRSREPGGSQGTSVTGGL